MSAGHDLTPPLVPGIYESEAHPLSEGFWPYQVLGDELVVLPARRNNASDYVDGGVGLDEFDGSAPYRRLTDEEAAEYTLDAPWKYLGRQS